MQDIATILNAPGAISVIPTDTVYGVVARAEDTAAVTRLYALKSRENKPGTLIAASIDQLVALGIKRRYLTAVEQFWPGAVSVIIPCGPELLYLHQGVSSLAVRITNDAALVGILSKTGALLSSSANQPGKPPANTIDDARMYFGDSVDAYIDGGDMSGREPSTVLRIVDDAIEIVRQGAVKLDEAGRIISS